jgi:hypothetical protein
MKARAIGLLFASFVLFIYPLAAEDKTAGALDLKKPILSGLSTPESMENVFFEWANAPGWVFTDIVFGVRKGSLVFAKFTAIPPGGEPRFHDKTSEVDYVIEDSKALPEFVAIDLGNGQQVLVKGFTIGMLANGRAVVDSAEGIDGGGRDFKANFVEAGSCGAPFVIGSCTDFCAGSCLPNVSSGDPCVCSGVGGCTTGNARWVCSVGSCTTACAFTAGIGCVCL